MSWPLCGAGSPRKGVPLHEGTDRSGRSRSRVRKGALGGHLKTGQLSASRTVIMPDNSESEIQYHTMSISVRTVLCLCLAPLAVSAGDAKVHSLQVRLLSTMLTAYDGYGEWGFSALVTADGHKILFDTGAHPDTVLRNAHALQIDLSDVPDVILSHFRSEE